jgi:hypothetical protein
MRTHDTHARAQIHLRHLVGGRARSYMGEIPNERMFQVRGRLWGCQARGGARLHSMPGAGGRLSSGSHPLLLNTTCVATT